MSLELDKRHIMVSVVVAALAFVSGKYLADMAIASPDVSSSAGSKTEGEPAGTVDLSETQLQAIKIEAVGTYHFRVEKRAVGSIAYHEQDASSSALPWHTVGAVAPDSTAKSLTKLLVANIQESDSPLIRVGQPVEAKAEAYPDRTFDGKVSALGAPSMIRAATRPSIPIRTGSRCIATSPTPKTNCIRGCWPTSLFRFRNRWSRSPYRPMAW